MLEVRQKKTLPQKFRLFLKGLFFVLILLVFFSSRLKPLEGEHRFSSLLQNLIYPFQYALAEGKAFASQTVNHYLYLVGTAKDNTRLKQENFLLKSQLLDYNELMKEIEELKELLRFTEKAQTTTFQSTRVLGGFHHPISQGIRVSSGTLDGIEVGMPVVSPHGVIGKVVRTTHGFSDVMLVTDTHFVLDILVERTKQRAILKGNSYQKCSLETPKQTDLRVGDTLITSGFLGVFPKGIPVGLITEITINEEDAIKTAVVQLWSQEKALDKAIILKSKTKEPLASKKGKDQGQ